MCSDVVIRAEGIEKIFPIYTKPHHRLLEMLSPVGRRYRKDFHALKGIDLEIRKGHAVGIVGRNGSGKSTLLQIICGTLAPTAGRVDVTGRLAALLELGAGFNLEFTGLENVFLNATILGLERREIEARLDDILAFADIGDFIHQPVKNYSSGMFVRLAFAVAINVTPEILVVDEALSVGDEAFQRKCFARIEALRQRGTTLLFVSHSAGTVIDLCDRALWLDEGELMADGSAREVVAQYQRFAHASDDRKAELRRQLRERRSTGISAAGLLPEPAVSTSGVPASIPAPQGPEDGFDPGLVSSATTAYENRGAEILEPRVETLDGRKVNLLVTGRRYRYRYDVAFERSAAGVRFGMMVRTLTGSEVGGAASPPPSEALPLIDRGNRIEVCFEFECRMLPGVYFFNAGVLGREGEEEIYLDRRLDLLMVRVQPFPRMQATGVVDLGIVCTLQQAP
ncbi:ABC transporter ATP-binding protein [Thermomonas sp.]|uniref:ABC transporter ATP-binding protein n=1 Tax=Thermomonas sp. TaxID=1971895 RepID=UPI00391BF72B